MEDVDHVARAFPGRPRAAAVVVATAHSRDVGVARDYGNVGSRVHHRDLGAGREVQQQRRRQFDHSDRGLRHGVRVPRHLGRGPVRLQAQRKE